jgi:hypothetical protein
VNVCIYIKFHSDLFIALKSNRKFFFDTESHAWSSSVPCLCLCHILTIEEEKAVTVFSAFKRIEGSHKQ